MGGRHHSPQKTKRVRKEKRRRNRKLYRKPPLYDQAKTFRGQHHIQGEQDGDRHDEAIIGGEPDGGDLESVAHFQYESQQGSEGLDYVDH